MHISVEHVLLFSGLGLWILALGYGIASGRVEISVNKGRFRTYSSILFACGLSAMCLALIITIYKGHHFSVVGRIEQARVLGSSRNRRTEILLKPDAFAGFLVLHASGSNPYFRPGEQVSLTYQEHTGSILKARFLSATGKQEGAYNNPVFLWPSAGVLASLLIIIGAVRQQRRDPEGTEDNHRTAYDLDGSVDTRSLLHLSSDPPENRPIH